jgi:hypothetical protein
VTKTESLPDLTNALTELRALAKVAATEVGTLRTYFDRIEKLLVTVDAKVSARVVLVQRPGRPDYHCPQLSFACRDGRWMISVANKSVQDVEGTVLRLAAAKLPALIEQLNKNIGEEITKVRSAVEYLKELLSSTGVETSRRDP